MESEPIYAPNITGECSCSDSDDISQEYPLEVRDIKKE
jgi:hypothetical protein